MAAPFRLESEAARRSAGSAAAATARGAGFVGSSCALTEWARAPLQPRCDGLGGCRIVSPPIDAAAAVSASRA